MNLKILFRKLTRDIFTGEAKSNRQSYRGVDFAEFRDYDPRIDPVRAVDIRASLKRNKLMIKLMEAEKSFPAVIALDVSASFTELKSDSQSKIDQAQDIMKSLSVGLIEASAKIGLMLFSDRIEVYSKPKFGLNSAKRNIRTVRSHTQEGGSAGETDFSKVLDFMAREAKKPTMFIVISDGYFGESDRYKRKLARLSRKHDILFLTIRDRVEMEMPKIRLGEVNFRDMETGKESLGDKIQVDNSLAEACEQIGISQACISPDQRPAQKAKSLSSLFLNHRKRRKK